MGESDTGWTPAFNVLYWPLRAFSRGLFDEIPALPSAHVDIVPVDYVADALVHLLDRDDEGVFNLVAGREAPFANELVELALRPLRPAAAGGRRRAAGATTTSTAPSTCRTSTWSVVFDDSRARALLGPGRHPPPRLTEYFGRLIDYAEAVRWGKRSMTRDEAREWLAESEAAAA